MSYVEAIDNATCSSGNVNNPIIDNAKLAAKD